MTLSPATVKTERPKEHGTLFNGAMIRSLLAGRKFHTRRVIVDSNSVGNYKASQLRLADAWIDGIKVKAFLRPDVAASVGEDPDSIVERLYCRWEVGDRMWARETYSTVDDREHGGELWYDYRATPKYSAERPAGWENAPNDPAALKWKPSLLMPRVACRIALEITEVRPERLQDLSEADAIAEGLSQLSKDGGRTWKYGVPDRDGQPGTDNDGMEWFNWSVDPRVAFANYWDSLNGERGDGQYSWAANPLVWVRAFRRVTP